MGAGYHGGFGKTYGAIAGDAVLRSEPEKYFRNIARRSDIDQNGMYDVVAHGGEAIIQITHDGQCLEINSRTAARMIESRPDYHRGQPIRLLSCNTGSSIYGFAQNLANKMNVVVEAPTKMVWAYPNGRYIVAGVIASDPPRPNLNDRGTFVRFYPGGNRR